MIHLIADSFKNLTPLLWLSQISGLIGLIVIGISYLFEKKKFLGIATVSFIFFIMEQAFASLYSNLIVSGVCFIRNLLMFIILLKYNKELPRWSLAVLLSVMWGGELIYMGVTSTFDVWDNYLPPVIVTMSTCTQNSKNDYVVKIGSTLHETGFLIYYLVYLLPLSIFRQLILVLCGITGLVLLIIRSYNNKKAEAMAQSIDSYTN